VAVWPRIFSGLASGAHCRGHGHGRGGDDRENGVEAALPGGPYLLQRRQGDVQVAHGRLREPLGVLAVLEEGDPTAGLLAVVSHLQHNTAGARLLLHFVGR